MRDAAINLRATPEQRDLIDQVYFRLDSGRFKNFVRLLDAPPVANAAQDRLMAVKAPWAEPDTLKASP